VGSGAGDRKWVSVGREKWANDDVAAIMAQIGAFNPPWGCLTSPHGWTCEPMPRSRRTDSRMTNAVLAV
jgi:hypothetical protein